MSLTLTEQLARWAKLGPFVRDDGFCRRTLLLTPDGWREDFAHGKGVTTYHFSRPMDASQAADWWLAGALGWLPKQGWRVGMSDCGYRWEVEETKTGHSIFNDDLFTILLLAVEAAKKGSEA